MVTDTTEIPEPNEIIPEPIDLEPDISDDVEFVKLLSIDNDIPKELEPFIDISGNIDIISDVSDAVLDTIVEDLESYNGALGALKAAIEGILDL